MKVSRSADWVLQLRNFY